MWWLESERWTPEQRAAWLAAVDHERPESATQRAFRIELDTRAQARITRDRRRIIHQQIAARLVAVLSELYPERNEAA